MVLHHVFASSSSSSSSSLVASSLVSMGRPPCCDKMNVKRGPWTAEEDAKILAHVSNHGVGNWTLVPKKAGLNRCGKSCRLRWTNYLRPDLKHDAFTPQEEEIIINLHNAVGSRWSIIARQLPGRTDNDVKNYWNTKLKKKLLKMGIDPLTHKPLSQLLSDFGNITTSLLLPQQTFTTPFNHNNNKINGHSWDFSQHSYYVPAAPNDQFFLGDSVSFTGSNQTLEQYQAHNEGAATLQVQNASSSSCSEVYGNSAASSSTSSSFVDAILDHERQLCSQFPHLDLDTSFD